MGEKTWVLDEEEKVPEGKIVKKLRRKKQQEQKTRAEKVFKLIKKEKK